MAEAADVVSTAGRRGRSRSAPPAAGTLSRLRPYVALTKPRIVELLLITTLPTMFLAAGGVPSAVLMIATLTGGALVAGSANAINCYLDRDIDRRMHRTAGRPLAQGVIDPKRALVFALAVGVIGTTLLAFAVNWQSAVLADVALLFYVFVYTLGLKRRSASNIVIGGAAGCFPVLVGWSAVTGTLGWPALVLFLVIFFWTPPHFWALAMKYEADYAAVGVPMLPVVADSCVVTRRILVYSCAMVAASLLLTPAAGLTYGAGAALLGVVFLIHAQRLHRWARSGAAPNSIRLFHASIRYLALLFVLIAITALV